MQGLTQWQRQCSESEWRLLCTACLAADLLDTGPDWHIWSRKSTSFNAVQMGSRVYHGLHYNLCRCYYLSQFERLNIAFHGKRMGAELQDSVTVLSTIHAHVAHVAHANKMILADAYLLPEKIIASGTLSAGTCMESTCKWYLAYIKYSLCVRMSRTQDQRTVWMSMHCCCSEHLCPLLEETLLICSFIDDLPADILSNHIFVSAELHQGWCDSF